MCKEKYGIENIVFMLNASPGASVFKTKPGKQRAVVGTFLSAVERLGGTNSIVVERDIDDELLEEPYADLFLKIAREQYPDVEALYSGFSIVHHEAVQIMIDSGWSTGAVSYDQMVEYYRINKDKYPATTHLYDECGFTGGLYFASMAQLNTGSVGVRHALHAVETLVSPFASLSTSDVIQLYDLMGYIDELPLTMSCNTPANQEVHCGMCKNCIERKYAFFDSGVEDRTTYQS